MKIKINKVLFNKAIEQTYKAVEGYMSSPDEFVSLVWDAYRVIVLKEEEDKKEFNGNLLMDIPGVQGFDYKLSKKEVEVKTEKGKKVYKVGRVTMATIIKRVEEFVNT